MKVMCPYCESDDAYCHLGHCECFSCGQEWSRIDALRASIKARVAHGLLKDIELHAAGDVERFSRMVSGLSETLGSREKWLHNVRNILDTERIAEFMPRHFENLKNRLALYE